MNENKILEEEIDRYLEGSMTKEEKEAFNSRIEKDPELRNEVELQRSIIKAVRKERLEKIIQKEEGRITKKRGIRKLVISVGSFAMAASIMGFFYIGYLNNCEKIANMYYEPYDYTLPPSRGGENLTLTKSDSIFYSTPHQMNKGSFTSHHETNNIIRGGENLPLTKSDSVFFNAIQQLEDGHNKIAIKQLQNLNSTTSEQAVKWYLSLAYLKNGEKKKARILLQEIANKPNSEYLSKAKDLLKEL